jgi:class 3 adenylate cyclase
MASSRIRDDVDLGSLGPRFRACDLDRPYCDPLVWHHERKLMPLPTGTLTFLFTDIEASTLLAELDPQAMGRAQARHDELLVTAVESQGGHIFGLTGDGVRAVF